MIEFLYTTKPGRMLLYPLTRRSFSDFVGKLADHPLSTILIPFCVRSWNLDLNEYRPETYRSYNAFFKRNIRPEARPIEGDEDTLISPCDSLVTVVPLDGDPHMVIKHTSYKMSQILRSPKTAERFAGGTAVIFRLTVSDYHRYGYAVSGRLGTLRHIQGIYHTVQPIANDHVPVYKENTREYVTLFNRRWKNPIQMEVGAMCVGRICNYHSRGQRFTRGELKGNFEFGGSTVVLFLEKGAAEIREDLCENSRKNIETKVRFGEAIGRRMETKE